MNNQDTVPGVIEAGNDTNMQHSSYDQFQLRIAIGQGHLRKVRRMLEEGMGCNERDGTEGPTALHVALKEASLEMVELLVDHGADITLKILGDDTSLHKAALNSHVDVIQFVLDQGLDIDLVNLFGSTALHYAISSDNYRIGICETLLWHGADVNIKTMIEHTPLTLALWHGRPKALVELLLEYGADATVKRENKSLLEIAMAGSKTKYHQYVRVLIQQLAKLKHQNLSINECDREIMESDDRCKDYYEKCSQEFRDMKEAKFYNDLSVFDICMGSEKVTFGYAKNEELVEELEKGAYGLRFPIYFTCLTKKFYVEAERQKLRNSAAKTLCNIFELNDPSHIIIQKIIRYLKDEDLEFLEM